MSAQSKLILVHLLQRIVVIERGVGGALRRQRVRSSAKRPSATAAASTTAITPSTVSRARISGQSNAFTSGFGSARPEVSMTMCSSRSARFQQLLDRRHEIVGDRAADAAVGEFDDVVLRQDLDAAAFQDLAIDADIAELVDDRVRAAGRRRSPADGGSAWSCRRRGSR